MERRLPTCRRAAATDRAADAEWGELVCRVDALPKPRVLDRWVCEEADIDEAIDRAIADRRFANLLESIGTTEEGSAPLHSTDELEAMRGPLKAQHVGVMAEWAKQHEPLHRRLKELSGEMDALTSAIDETPVLRTGGYRGPGGYGVRSSRGECQVDRGAPYSRAKPVAAGLQVYLRPAV